jgi:hypothetical protein
MEAGPPDAPSTTDRMANLRIHDSTPETVMPDGNKSGVWGVGVGSNPPATNFPGISVDSNRVDRLVEKGDLSGSKGVSLIRTIPGYSTIIYTVIIDTLV